MPNNINENNLKEGDEILVEDAWEDEAGGRHDEVAEIIAIDPMTGELSLKFTGATPEIQEFLETSDGYMANDYEKHE